MPRLQREPSEKRLRLLLALVGALVAVGCHDDEGEEIGRGQAPIVGGSTDTSGLFPYVVRVVNGGSGTCSAVVTSERVVLTAAHCVKELAAGCTSTASSITFDYQQPAPGQPPSNPPYYVRVPDVSDGPYVANWTIDIEVTAVQIHRTFLPRVLKDCCEGEACEACESPWLTSLSYPTHVHDIALLYLAEPLPSHITANLPRVLTQALGAGPYPTDPSRGIYSVDPAAFVGKTAVLAGTSNAGPSTQPQRAFGLATVDSLNFSSLASYCDASTAPTSVNDGCNGCALITDESPAYFVSGDSGGPTFLNDTRTGVGADAITAFGSDIVVAGIHSTGGSTDAGTWSSPDATYNTWAGLLAPTNGDWLLDLLDDFDGDNIPNAFDNCPTAWNADQHNCNETAELAKGYPKRGDVCDPIPCSALKIDPVQTTTTNTSSNGSFYIVTKSWARNEFDVAPLSSRHFGNGSNLGDERQGLTTLSSVATKYRFCQNDPTTSPPVNCTLSSHIDASWVDATEDPPAVGNPWHAISVKTAPTGSPFSAENLAHASTFKSLSGAPSYARLWDHQGDSATWEGSSLITPVAVSGDTGLDGRLWLHAASSAGTVTASSSTGYRTKTNGSTSSDDQHLSNHYFDLDVDGFQVLAIGGSGYVLDPDPYFEFKLCDPLLPLFDGVPGETTKMVKLPDGEVGAILRTGEVMALDEMLDVRSGLAALMHSGGEYVWASAIEPSTAWTPTGDEGGLYALVLDPEEPNVIIEAVMRIGDYSFGTLDDFSRPSLQISGGPESRTGFAAVFSRADQRLFIVGGENEGFLGEIWMRGIGDSFGWYQVPLQDYEPQHVLAATYSPADGLLWVLDDAEGEVRLYRVHPYRGATELVASWERSEDWDRQWLEIDRDGQVLLFSSNSTEPVHAFARLATATPGGPVIVENYTGILEGELVLDPSIDMRGYTLYHPTSTGVTVERLDALSGSAASLEDLEDVL